MKNTNAIIAGIVLVVVVGLGIYIGTSTDVLKSLKDTPTPDVKESVEELKPIKTASLEVDNLTYNATISSPITITGRAKGWMFEASFPIRIIDANGKLVAQAPAQATAEWMTAEFVPFELTMTFERPETETGTIIFEKDNASGLPENAEEVRVPIKFAVSGSSSDKSPIAVLLYYPKKMEGVDVCDSSTIVAVSRTIPYTKSTLRDTIELLIQGQLTPAEKTAGFATEFPNPGFKLESVNIENGVATMKFSDANNFSIGGSCRVGLLAQQIIKTAKQFPAVKSVRFIPEDELFQP